ncbi:Repeat domain-containing protein [Granulicella pectinivorans]|uniref:Repeat domain-containing protein n=2 Tax=Granulicella pectinivorans TaxID=474950 RepID=A0A1I6MDA2_9BACT|nr:Repeat domain-containing protein [Granulicella pectinivorans]
MRRVCRASVVLNLMKCVVSPRLLLALLLTVSADAIAQTPAKTSSPGTFVEVTAASGVSFQHVASHTAKKYLLETMGSGVAMFDYDNDGRLDLFFANGAPLSSPTPKGTIPQKSGPRDWNRLYHQKADGTFEDVTEKAGLQGMGYALGVAVGDYDNDGFEDLLVTGYGGSHLYHNNGNGTFTDVTAPAGVAGGGFSTSAAWIDLDHDGRLDLVVLRYVQWDFDDIWCGEHRDGYRAYCHPDIFPAIAPLVYHNDGVRNGVTHFTEIGAASGISVPAKGLGIAIADYDRDGYPDIVIANDSMLEHLYRNKGNGTFEEVGMTAEIAVDGDGRTYAGMGVDFADYNNDGLPDLVITNLASQKYAMYANNGDGSFSYASYSTGLAGMTQLHSGWGIRFMDYDNDGLKDLLVAQGHDLDTVELNFSAIHYREPMMLARNTGHGFVDVSEHSGEVFKQAWVGRGMALGDLYNDGHVDAVVSTNDGPAHILRNETVHGNHWLGLNLVGHRSNRDAIGAEVKLVTTRGPQWETVSTASSYLSASDKRLHFGLGADTTASLEILWPSGIRQTLKDVAADQILKVDEPSEAPAPSTTRKAN